MEKPLKDLVASEAFRGLSRREQFSIRSLAGSGLPLAGEPTVNDLKAWSRVLEAHGGVQPGQSFVGVRAVDRGRGLAPRRGLAGPAFRRPDAAAALAEPRPSALAEDQGRRRTSRTANSLAGHLAPQLAGTRSEPARSFRAPSWFVDLVHSQAASGRPLWESASAVENGRLNPASLGLEKRTTASALPYAPWDAGSGQANDRSPGDPASAPCGCKGSKVPRR